MVRKVHVVFKTHLDIGFTDLAEAVVRHYLHSFIPAAIKAASGPLYTLLENKYYFDKFNERVLAGGAKLLGRGLWRGGDAGVIDGLIVGGAVRLVSGVSMLVRFFQSGHIYHYAFTMIFGVCALLSFWLLRA